MVVFILFEELAVGYLEPCRFGESRHIMNLKVHTNSTTPLSLHYLSVSLTQ